ncbi:MAG: carboxylesterase family protein [Caulobacterales bacterium]
MSEVIHTADGAVKGVAQGDAVAFLGIPFARPPVGDLRWRAPEPPQPWANVRMADRFGANCPQPDLSMFGLPYKPVSEDCLFINVWAPKGAAGKKLPVMVWIHGGAYIQGSGDLDDTSAFTRDGVVFVSFNYRVGRLGFLAHPALTAEMPDGPLGNYGFLDQVLALKWVQANIAKFGGDPGNVTIFGVSAGGTFTNLHMYSPLSRGLFHRAIAQSDPFFQPWSYMASLRRSDGPPAETFGDRWATSLGLANATSAQLRAIPYEKSVVGPMEANVAQVKPIIDGEILPDRGPEAFAAGLAANVPYIIGATSYEGSLTAIYAMDPSPLIAALGDNAEAVLKAYGPEVAQNPSLLGAALTGDSSYFVPRRTAARLAYGHGIPTRAYHFAYVAEELRGKVPGAAHGSEIPYLFEFFKRSLMDAYDPTPADKQMAKVVHAYWVNFARTGDPNGPGLPAWPQFAAGDEQYLVFNESGGAQAVKELDHYRLDLVEPGVVERRFWPVS